MATIQKQSTTYTSNNSKKSGLFNKLKAMLPQSISKQTKKKPTPVMTKAAKMAADFDHEIKITKSKADKAHAPGHRKLNLKSEVQAAAGENVHAQEADQTWTAPGDRIKQVKSSQKRPNSRSSGPRNSR